MLKILRYSLSLAVIIIAAYGLVTKSFELSPLMLLLLGLMMLVMGVEEFQKERKTSGWLLVVVFLFSLFASIQGFLFR